MRCLHKNCDVEMEHRTGKYGGFWYCKSHGTFSDKRVGMSASVGYPAGSNLMREIKHQTLGFGVDISELESWIVDNEDAADYEEDHWMNMRPY